MYSNEKSVQILLSLLKEYHIKHVILSPGGSVAPLIKSFEYDDYFECYSVVDERNAAYIALGMAQEYDQPIACVCTAGTAVINYMAGIAEAYYQNIPIIAITSDSSSYWLDQLELQKIPQEHIFCNFVKKEISLPVVQSEMDEWQCNRLINEALLSLNYHGRGPVHINVPIEQTLECNVDKLIKQRVIRQHNIKKTNLKNFSQYLKNKSIMVIVGGNEKFDKEDIELLNRFYSFFNCIFSIESISNLSCNGCIRTYPVTETGLVNYKLIPDIVISLGNFVATYKMKDFLRNNRKKIENWLISESGQVRDPYWCLTNVFEGSKKEFFEGILFYANDNDFLKEHSYYNDWEQMLNEVDLSELGFSSLSVAKILSSKLPKSSLLHTAILNSTRVMQFFEFNESVKYYSNLGTLGIDGCVSTFIGHSMATNNLCYLLIGDLSFFYGMNGIGVREVKNNVRIILLNNGGGEEFKIKLPYDSMEKFICAQYRRTAKEWVKSLGFDYYSATTNSEVEEILSSFSKVSTKPMFLEVFFDIDKDSKIICNIYKKSEEKIKRKQSFAKRYIWEMVPLNKRKKIKKIISILKE